MKAKEGCLLWPWAFGLKCLNNDEASSPGMPSGSARNCPVVQPLCKLLESFMVHILNGKFFVLETSCVCSNVVPKLNRQEHNVSLLTQHYACRDLDDKKERTLRR